MCGHLQFVVDNPQKMKNILQIMRNELMRWGKMFFDFFELFISKEKYPYQPVILIEESL